MSDIVGASGLPGRAGEADRRGDRPREHADDPPARAVDDPGRPARQRRRSAPCRRTRRSGVRGAEPIPTAGPYYFASFVPERRLVLRRNPNYGGTRPARFREIDVEPRRQPRRAATAAVLAGRADYVTAAAARPAGGARPALRAAQRGGSHRAPALLQRPARRRCSLFVFNRQRRAVRAAVGAPRRERRPGPRRAGRQRDHAVSGAGVPGRPTDQFVPYGLPDSATWPSTRSAGPIPRRSRGSPAAAARGARSSTPATTRPACSRAGSRERDLAAIGIDLDVRAFSFGEMFERLYTPGEPWDLGFYGWVPAYADGADFISSFFAPSLSGFSLPGSVPDPALERRIRAATRLPRRGPRPRHRRDRRRPLPLRRGRPVRHRRRPPTSSPTASAARSTSRSTASRSARSASGADAGPSVGGWARPMRASGVATIMFTDLEASTDTTTRLGDDAAAALFAGHDRIVREQLAAHGGRNARSTGDGFLVLFDSARSAVACALAIQRELAAHEDGVRVRIGLNAGEVQEGEDGALFGAAINLASRVMDRADGGEILVTDTVRQLVGTHARRALPRPRPRRLQGFPRAPAPLRRQAGRRPGPPRAPPREALAQLRRPHPRRRPSRPSSSPWRRCSSPRAAPRPSTSAQQRGHPRPRGRPSRRAGPRRRCARPTSWSAQARSGCQPGDNTVTRIGAALATRRRHRSPRHRPSTGSGPAPAALGGRRRRAMARVIDPAFRTVARYVPARLAGRRPRGGGRSR